VPDLAKQALYWQGGANALAWAIGADKQRKGGFKGTITGNQPVIIGVRYLWRIMAVLELVMAGYFGGKGGQLAGGCGLIHAGRIVTAKAKLAFCHDLAPNQRRRCGACFISYRLARQHPCNFFGALGIAQRNGNADNAAVGCCFGDAQMLVGTRCYLR